MRPDSSHVSARRQLLPLLIAFIVSAGLILIPGQMRPTGPVTKASGHVSLEGLVGFTSDPGCGEEGYSMVGDPSGPRACVHGDPVPAGLDPRGLSGAALSDGADATIDKIVAEYAEQGIATPTILADAASDGKVACDDDGTSGNRAQSLYVVEASATDNYLSDLAGIRSLTASIGLAYNRKAAAQGGVRNVRFVTEGSADSSGNCMISVIKVVVPDGAMSSFQGSITALRNAGYSDTHRKYLIWADSRVGLSQGWCGIALMYPDDQAGPSNANNGSYSQYARAEQPCWDSVGSAGHSTMLHEFTHTLGAVMPGAPNHSKNGHCTDESDVMCYADGAGVTMRQVCPLDQEDELDCQEDDYFSISPPDGSWLASHWNTASSSFLLSTGPSGSGGYSTRANTKWQDSEEHHPCLICENVPDQAHGQGGRGLSWDGGGSVLGDVPCLHVCWQQTCTDCDVHRLYWC